MTRNGSAPLGYAVVDTETTGVAVGYRHRVAEVAVVQVSPEGDVTGEWATLVNPERDLGPQAIHGIRGADARRAPRFADVAGDLVERLRGRVVVAHNWPFDAMHLHAELERLGVASPFHPRAGLCTMRAAAQALPGVRRSLIECCAAAGLPDCDWHTALDDARASADLLAHFLASRPGSIQVGAEHLAVAQWPWPDLPTGRATPVRRRPRGHVEPHFLARLVDRIPREGQPVTDAYLAMLDRALLDRRISATEADGLLELAHALGLHRSDARAAHEHYLRELGRAVWLDGVLTDEERAEVETVARLLDIDDVTVDRVLAEERDAARHGEASGLSVEGLRLAPGEKVVLTGTMRRGRAEIVAEAEAAGLDVVSSVSRKTAVVVAADPDSVSGKAKNARSLGVPVVDEECFLQVLRRMPVGAPHGRAGGPSSAG